MELLKGRPLLAISIVSIFLMFLTSRINSLVICVSMTLICAAFIAVYVLCTTRRGYRKKMRWPKLFIYVSAFLIISLTLSLRAFDFYNVKMRSVDDVMGKERLIKGEIVDVGYKGDYSERLYADIYSIDGVEFNLKAVIDVEGPTELDAGEIFTLVGSTEEFSDEESYLISDGNAAKIVCVDLKSITVDGECERGLIYWFGDLNDEIAGRIYRFLDGDAANLINALTLGNDDLLEDNIIRDFRRCGISHVIALSGLHLSIILGFFDFILQRFRIPRGARCIILLPLGLFYLALTGFSESCSRALIMVGSVYFAYIFRKESDSVTALALAAVIILAISPYALFSVSLWMSVIAVLGIIVVSEIISPLGYKIKKKSILVQIAYKLLTAISITLAAIFFVFIFNWLLFGEISIISPITNLLIAPFIPILLVGGLLMLIASPALKIAKFIASILEVIANIVLGLSAWFSDAKGVTVSLEYSFVKFIAIPFIAALIIFLIVKIRRKWTIAIIPSITVIAFCICFNVYLSNNAGVTKVSYLKDNTSEMIVLKNNSSATVCDISTGGYRHLNKACETAYDNGATEIENIVLTHYHNYHAPTLLRISKKYMVRNVLLPEPDGYDESASLEHIKLALESIGVNVITYRRDYSIDVGESCELTVSSQYYIRRSEHSMLMIRIKVQGGTDQNELLYYSSPLFESENVDYPTLPDYFIIGNHGPKIHKAPSVELIMKSAPGKVLLADGEKMLSNDEIISDLESLISTKQTEIIFEKDEYEFILKRAKTEE